ncbi:hypothetical protein GCM10009092_37680 [Bowmanella denitrificans]|uniref:Uncharacterized protein n=1 Tax=Bowmanella denitrificans TaxID=366582 RepID=A0ABN0XPX2_9ALTE
MSDKQSSQNEVTQQTPSDSGAGKGNARRRFILGAAAPVVLSVISKPVMATGKVCNPSGFMSANPSGVSRHYTHSTCGGFSKDYWKKPYENNCYADWKLVGLIPRWPEYGMDGIGQSYSVRRTCRNNYKAWFNCQGSGHETQFRDVFSAGPYNCCVETALRGNVGELEQYAMAAYMNALKHGWGRFGDSSKIDPDDVTGLYNACKFGQSSYYAVSGAQLQVPSSSDLLRFFIGLSG